MSVSDRNLLLGAGAGKGCVGHVRGVGRGLSHTKPDYAAAVIYGSIIGWLYLRTKSVGACVIAHGVSNLLMGIYIMVTKQWGLW
ncbi:MAG: type II CAAX prenyl endopeptidase Rce1 family protein [Verrucomicrobiales bacterium]